MASVRRFRRRAMAPFVFSLAALACSTGLRAADTPAAELKVAVVCSGLNQPTAIAIEPDNHDIWISERGAGRVVRVSGGGADAQLGLAPANPRPAQAMISDFERGGGDGGIAGPFGLAFVHRRSLAVATSRGAPGEKTQEIVVYALDDDGGLLAEKPQKLAVAGDGAFEIVTTTPTSLVACSLGGTAGVWVGRSPTSSGKARPLKTVIEAPASQASDAAGLTVSPRGEVVLAYGVSPERASLQFFIAKTGRLLLDLPVDVPGVSALAYSPQTGRLYALGRGSQKQQGGLFRLDAALDGKRPAVKATRLLSLDRPTALAFVSEGALYVTTLGPEKNGAEGQLLEITGKL